MELYLCVFVGEQPYLFLNKFEQIHICAATFAILGVCTE